MLCIDWWLEYCLMVYKHHRNNESLSTSKIAVVNVWMASAFSTNTNTAREVFTSLIKILQCEWIWIICTVSILIYDRTESDLYLYVIYDNDYSDMLCFYVRILINFHIHEWNWAKIKINRRVLFFNTLKSMRSHPLHSPTLPLLCGWLLSVSILKLFVY